MPNRHELELELQGTQLIVTALLLEREDKEFEVTDEKLAEASKWQVDAYQTFQDGSDILFLTPKGTDNG